MPRTTPEGRSNHCRPVVNSCDTRVLLLPLALICPLSSGQSANMLHFNRPSWPVQAVAAQPVYPNIMGLTQRSIFRLEKKLQATRASAKSAALNLAQVVAVLCDVYVVRSAFDLAEGL